MVIDFVIFRFTRFACGDREPYPVVLTTSRCRPLKQPFPTLSHWWTADVRADEKVGGKAEFRFEKHALVFRMNIEKLDPGKQVVWTCHGEHPEWDGTTLTWKISRENDATVLRFVHSNWKSFSDFCASCNSTWGELMYRLKDYVEGRNPGPHWKE